MQYGFVIPGGDPRDLPGLARVAEEAGWDGVFIPDAICIDPRLAPDAPGFDPWVVLAGMAMTTTRVKLGTMLTPVSRRRPWKLARETATLDRLSGGRVVLSVGLGALDDLGFGAVGEATDLKTRAELMDEGLEIMDGLWSGEPFSFTGKHYKVGEMVFVPRPVQTPRIPVWVVGMWPSVKSLSRAARWDGLLPAKKGSAVTPDDIRAMKAFIDEHRTGTTAYDIVMEGETLEGDRAEGDSTIREFKEAGVTWWLEAAWSSPHGGDADWLRRLVEKGPPRVD